MMGRENPIVKVKLDDGRIVKIDNAHATKDISDPERYEYLGEGVYYSVGETLQKGKVRTHCWRFKC